MCEGCGYCGSTRYHWKLEKRLCDDCADAWLDIIGEREGEEE